MHTISANSSQLHWTGHLGLLQVSTGVIPYRHKESFIDTLGSLKDMARAQTGIRLHFICSNSDLQICFSDAPLGAKWSSDYAVYCDGQWYGAFQSQNLWLETKTEGIHHWEICLSSFHTVCFEGIKSSQPIELHQVELKAPKYLCLGDSISQGIGQGSADYKTYPHLLAQAKKWTLENTAIGGLNTFLNWDSILQDREADYISLLIGFNDWCYYNNAEAFEKQLNKLCLDIRKYHPQAKTIACLPLFHTTSQPEVGSEEFDVFYKICEKVYSKQGFSFCQPPHLEPKHLDDNVHLNAEGAEILANHFIEQF